MTKTQAIAAIKKLPNMTACATGQGDEIRVRVVGSPYSEGYFTDDPDDAVNTATLIQQRVDREAPAKPDARLTIREDERQALVLLANALPASETLDKLTALFGQAQATTVARAFNQMVQRLNKPA